MRPGAAFAAHWVAGAARDGTAPSLIGWAGGGAEREGALRVAPSRAAPEGAGLSVGGGTYLLCGYSVLEQISQRRPGASLVDVFQNHLDSVLCHVLCDGPAGAEDRGQRWWHRTHCGFCILTSYEHFIERVIWNVNRNLHFKDSNRRGMASVFLLHQGKLNFSPIPLIVNIHHNMDDLADSWTPLSSLTQKHTLKYVRCRVFRFR
ncbi:uncharacterized protein LOC120765228 [Hirundo rustica]|uniref:uncharacterized protein LOC120765228 n=1 Tax=Hirundo rustica TaxID=43150 RepID=UPI001A93B341|nr:uncharacterized protein LOC120765228 [Hirundo rustica]